MKIIVTTIALALTSTAAMADAPSTSLRPPEVCRKSPIANTNAFQWKPQGCKGDVIGGEAEDVATGSVSAPKGAVDTTGTPTGPTGTTGSTGSGKSKSNASDHNGKGGNQFDGSKNSDKGMN